MGSLQATQDTIPTHSVCEHILTYFHRVVNQHDVIDALHARLEVHVKKQVPRNEQKCMENLHRVFVRAFNEVAFGLMQCSRFPQLSWADSFTDMRRSDFMRKFMSSSGDGVRNGAGEVSRLLSKDFHYKPFDIKKLTFHALAVDCVADEMIAIGEAE